MAYLKLWRKAKKDTTLKRVPNFWELAMRRKMQVPNKISSSPRVRSMLKIVSEQCNILRPNMMINVSQSVDRFGISDDKRAMTLTQHCGDIYAPLFSAFLAPEQCWALQGLALCRGVNDDDNHLYRAAGSAMSAPVVGSLMWAVVSQLAAQ